MPPDDGMPAAWDDLDFEEAPMPDHRESNRLQRAAAAAFGLCAALTAVLAAGCGEDLGQATGELGAGTFQYECVDSTDYACRDPEASFRIFGNNPLIPDALPRAVAVGSEFRLSFLAWESAPCPDLFCFDPATEHGPATPISTDLVTVLGADRYRAKWPGFLGFYGMTQASDGTLIADILHVEALWATDVQVRVADGSDVPTRLAPLASATLMAFPADVSGAPLGGTVVLTWETSDSNVLSVQQTSDGLAQVNAVNPGQAMITVRTSAPVPPVSTQLAIEVSP
jgi:hypothetical protein